MWDWEENLFAGHRANCWIILKIIKIAALSLGILSPIFSILTARGDNKQQSKRFIAELCDFLHIVSVSNQDLMIALELPFNDFEDAMQCASAMACNADVIARRNVKDYQNASIKTVTPEQFLQELRGWQSALKKYLFRRKPCKL